MSAKSAASWLLQWIRSLRAFSFFESLNFTFLSSAEVLVSPFESEFSEFEESLIHEPSIRLIPACSFIMRSAS